MTEQKPWLSLPDEEPPERGLAELMAAARMKAEVMARPPWWRRMFDVLRRPPVLALATILVLLGGVLVVGRHPDQVQAPAITAASPAPVSPPAQVVAPLPAAEQPPSPESRPAAQVVAPPPPMVTPKHIAKRPVAKPEPRPIETKTIETKAMDRSERQLAAPQAASDIAVDGDADDAPVQKGAVAGGPRNASVTTDPLARCRAVAARKDCAGVKACVQQLPQTVRATAARDAALKSCL